MNEKEKKDGKICGNEKRDSFHFAICTAPDIFSSSRGSSTKR